MDYYDLGSYTRKVTTATPEAQLWFDRGLNWLFGSNHAEAIACFRKALERDSACARRDRVRRGNYEVAFAHLRRSVELDDALPYDEPWGLMQPTRHALGALLLEQGRVAEAEAIYRSDLGLDGKLSRACQHPDNLWSLHVLHECLTRRGETVEAALIKQRLDLALARSEVPVKASCFCRMKGRRLSSRGAKRDPLTATTLWMTSRSPSCVVGPRPAAARLAGIRARVDGPGPPTGSGGTRGRRGAPRRPRRPAPPPRTPP